MEGNVYRIFKNKSNGLDYFNEKEGWGGNGTISRMIARPKFLEDCFAQRKIPFRIYSFRIVLSSWM